MKNVKLKRVLFLFFIQLLLIFGLCSCNSSKPSNKKSSLLNSVKEETITIEDVKDEPLAMVKHEGKWGVIDKEGNWIKDPTMSFKNVCQFSDGLAKAQAENDKWGFINKLGDWVITPRFSNDNSSISNTNLGYFNNNRAFAGTDFTYGIIDKEGNWIVEPSFFSIDQFSDGLAYVSYYENDQRKKGYVDTNGNIAFIFSDDNNYELILGFSEGLATKANSKGKIGYINKKGEWVIEAIYEDSGSFHEGLASATLNDKVGFIDKKGSWVIKPNFSLSSHFSEGLAAVELDGKEGMINTSGNWVIQPKYHFLGDCIEGMIEVWTGDKSGYLNKDGKVIVKPKYDETYPFSNGLSVVILNEKYGYIDKNGNEVVKPVFEDALNFVK
ncbi:WG repeat-containing protein [Oceanirhabdus seepicola]|uniref:WG repeat-containing protein n=1 Tax=Oceanirhabdus seepicola TaxID=2828781 RepID=A0A9J6P161_9CLOT|nr:WG repeat-containing protein [Oceanirhabdus seepicola]MCM1989833.1 WG repeat-containing protein [Oceanirhabdus seepicola]